MPACSTARRSRTFPLDKFEQVMSTNVTSAFLVGQAVAQAA